MKHLHPVICRVTRKSVSDGKSEVIHLGKAYLSSFPTGFHWYIMSLPTTRIVE
jgi:hypothetical protein